MAALDRQRLLRLLPYLARERRRLLLTVVLLIPLALAASVQPLLVGQAIAVLRGESVMPWLAGRPMAEALRLAVAAMQHVIPGTAAKVNAVLGHRPGAVWKDELVWGDRLAGSAVAASLVLFPRPEKPPTP